MSEEELRSEYIGKCAEIYIKACNISKIYDEAAKNAENGYNINCFDIINCDRVIDILDEILAILDVEIPPECYET